MVVSRELSASCSRQLGRQDHALPWLVLELVLLGTVLDELLDDPLAECVDAVPDPYVEVGNVVVVVSRAESQERTIKVNILPREWARQVLAHQVGSVIELEPSRPLLEKGASVLLPRQ